MKRMDNWHEPLKKALDEADKPFVWGENDCVSFALRCVEAQTGESVMSSIGNYKTAMGARRQIKKWGSKDLYISFSKLMSKLEVPEIRVPFAQRGDIVAIDDRVTGVCIGVVSLDNRYALFLDKEGLRKIPLLECCKAWRIE